MDPEAFLSDPANLDRWEILADYLTENIEEEIAHRFRLLGPVFVDHWEGLVPVFAKYVTLPKVLRFWNSRCFSPDGTLYVGSGNSRGIRVWDIRTGRVKWTFDVFIDWCPVCLSADGSLLAAAVRFEEPEDVIVGREIRLWDMKSGTLVGSLAGHEKQPSSLIMSPDGQVVILEEEESTTITLWDVETGKIRAVLEDYGFKSTFSPDGKLLAVLNELEDGKPNQRRYEINIFELDTGETRTILRTGSTVLTPIRFLHDNRLLAVEEKMMTSIELWDLETGKRTKSFHGWGGFSSDGRTLAMVNSEQRQRNRKSKAFGEIELWDLETNTLKGKIEEPEDLICEVVFSPDGKTVAGLVTNSPAKHHPTRPGWVKLWDTETGNLKRVVKGPFEKVWKAPWVSFALGGHILGLMVEKSLELFELWDITEREPEVLE